MTDQRLETTDIYKSAVFLCNGGRLAGTRLKKQKRRTISFLIEGDGIHQLDLDYRNGQALVNALRFKETLNHLRDVLFTRLREREGRYDGNRKGQDRAHQKKR